MESSPSQPAQTNAATGSDRRMVRTELMGNHSHSTLNGSEVHIWMRSSKYIARGSYQGLPFGETLGDDPQRAMARLQELLTELNRDCYIRPSEAGRRKLKRPPLAKLTLRQLIDECLAATRSLRGKQTHDTYWSRLKPVLEYAEQKTVIKRWPLALDCNRDFVQDLRGFLFQQQTTRNGRAGGNKKALSVRQIKNILECLRGLLSWARDPQVRKLPVDWANPVTQELIPRIYQDPLAKDRLPLELRIKLVGSMDRWQLCCLVYSVVLPLRAEEAAGLLVGDVNFDDGWFEIGSRFDGGDFTKGRQSFKLPFPAELVPIIKFCIGDRVEGPLLMARKSMVRQPKLTVTSSSELRDLYEQRLASAPRGEAINEQDRKRLFRQLLGELGGVSTDELAREFKGVLKEHGLAAGISLKTLRKAVTTGMNKAKLSHLNLRYLTSHQTNDILNEYVTLDPVEAMRPYFDSIRPLLDSIVQRAKHLGLI